MTRDNSKKKTRFTNEISEKNELDSENIKYKLSK
jgi:hypothetical protein